MSNLISIVKKASAKSAIAYIVDAKTDWSQIPISSQTVKYLKERFAKDNPVVFLSDFDGEQHPFTLYIHVKEKKELYLTLEDIRMSGAKGAAKLNANDVEAVVIENHSQQDGVLSLAEGIALTNYQFLKYKTNGSIKPNTLKKIQILTGHADSKKVTELNNVLMGVYSCRDLVNEPLMFLSAVQLSEELKKMGKDANFKVSVWNKKKIEAQKMGGLLAVNSGSQDPPTFNVLEWKPKNAKNSKPIILVGKGIMFDTGGINLKSSDTSMEFMKCDMGGAAMVACGLYAVAKNKLPIHVMAFIPATDNRPGENAYVPGDVITIHNGMTVEVLNTDAEGRLILADALSYAQSFDPELVIDAATLTGSSLFSIGPFAASIMGTVKEETMEGLKQSGRDVFERLVEMPFWDEYKDLLKSDIADMKNIGGRMAGAITAGKFLEHFTDYEWVHIDIAATAWYNKPDGYRSKNGTGWGVRLLYHFLKQRSEQS